MASGMRHALRVLGGRLGAQWERERRETLFLMAPVALSVLPHVAHLPWWTTVAFSLLFAWRLALVLSGRWLPRASVRWAAALACIVAVYAHYDTLLGREPGVALLVLFLGLKLMEMRARRDLFVVIFLCLFLLLAAFLHSQSIVTAAAVALALYGLLAAMLTMQFRNEETPLGQRLRSVGLMLAQALPVAAALFVLFPRGAAPLWGLPSDAQRARTGLSESMTPGAIASLAESDALAFRVRFDGKVPPMARMYWRGPVFGAFDGSTWRAATSRAPAAAPRVRFAGNGAPIRYTLTQEPTGYRWLFALEMPQRVRAGTLEVLHRADLQLVARSPLHARVQLTIESGTDYVAGEDETGTALLAALALPPGSNPRTQEMAALWRAQEGVGAQSDQRLIGRALALFGAAPFRYTHDAPALGRHSVDDFLFGTRAGFCEHYASAFAVLMRALGIPARIVTGYQGGELNPVDGNWQVRQRDAHAWSEVWLAERGWVRVDPTAAVAPERVERGVRADARRRALAAGDEWPLLLRLRFNLDALGHAWNQWILAYDGGRQRTVLERLGIPAADWRHLAALLAAALGASIGAVALLTLRPHQRRDPLAQAWDAFCERLAAVGLQRAPHETPSRYLARVARSLDPAMLGRARDIVAEYERLRYAEQWPDAAAVRNLRKSVQAFEP